MPIVPKKKVVVAMSGGVDSSVAAALLKKDGLNVVGVFMKFWAAPDEKNLKGSWNRCCSPEAETRARAVAEALNIPFYVLNFKKEFKKEVVDYFLSEYKKGRTPNPCVVCNKEIKFGLLLKKARAFGGDLVATGHYARKKEDAKTKVFKLLKAKDKVKDQSYFLWRLSQKQLERVIFPVGGYVKSETRKMAKEFKLPILNIPESQEVCFIKTTLEAFLSKYFKPKPGDIIDLEGNILGKHKGLFSYTIGQRKGIGLSGGPFWVSGMDIKKNVLIVARNEKDLDKKELVAGDVHWIAGKPSKMPIKVKVKIRYGHKAAPAILKELSSLSVKIVFNSPQRAITPGQSAVFYKGEELLGGGIIK